MARTMKPESTLASTEFYKSIRKFIALMALLTVLGCSGLSALVVRNHLATDVALTLKITEDNSDSRPIVQTVQVPSGESVESEIRWFHGPPTSIEATATDPAGNDRSGKWDIDSYPPGMAKGTSAGAIFTIDITDSGLVLRDPSQFENFIRNPQFAVLPLACPCFVVCTGLGLFLLRRKASNSRRS